jgi:hypothetical protein
MVLFCLALPAWSAPAADSLLENSGYSKQMRMAIQLYEDGRDLDAMDRFMDILVNGDPAERPTANEYLNRITQRMSLTGEIHSRPAPPAAVIETSGQGTRPAAAPVQERPEAAPPAPS